MTIIKYRTSYDTRIEKIEILRETTKQVVLPPWRHGAKERREAKESDYQNWHDTWGDAKNFLIDIANARVVRLRVLLAKAEQDLANMIGIENTQVKP